MNPTKSQESLVNSPVAERLRVVADRLEGLLQEQLTQWDGLVAEAIASEGGGPEQQDFQQRLRDLEVDRNHFELERDQERERLGDEASRLADAWRELEHEQRELKKQQQLGRSPANAERPAESVEPMLQTESATSLDDNIKSPTTSEVTEDMATIAMQAVPVQMPPSSQPVQEDSNRAQSPTTSSRQGPSQFQQLRREMMQHARQRRRR